MNDKPKNKPGPLVEDSTMVGGIDEASGEAVVRPKDTEGKAPKGTKPTDPREARKPA